MMKQFYKIFIGLLFLLAGFQGIQFLFQPVDIDPLNGAVVENPFPDFSSTTYWDATYQISISRYLNSHFGFRPLFVRLYNQVQNTVFNLSTANDIVLGKKGTLFEENEIRSYLGDDFIGESTIRQTVSKLERIQQFLKQQNSRLLILIAPNKTYFYPQFIRDYLKSHPKQTNYDYYTRVFDSSSLQVMDVHDWFLKIQPAIPMALMPKTGAHWSEYAAALVADSLLRRLGQLSGEQLAYFSWDEPVLSSKPRGTDNDLGKLLNLFYTPSDSAYFYTEHYTNLVSNPVKPKAIFIGDSFFWNLYYHEKFFPAFENLMFWYYYSSVYPRYNTDNYNVSELDVMSEIASRDDIIIVSSAANLKNLGYGFVDAVFNVLTKNDEKKLQMFAKEYESGIRNSEEQMEYMKEKAISRGISIDQMIQLDARWMAEVKMKRLFSLEAK